MPDQLTSMYRYVGKDYDERVLPSIVNEIVKTVVVSLNKIKQPKLVDYIMFTNCLGSI